MSEPESRATLLESTMADQGGLRLPDLHELQMHSSPQAGQQESPSYHVPPTVSSMSSTLINGEDEPFDSDGEKPDIHSFISVDEIGRPCSFGPSSALYRPANNPYLAASPPRGASCVVNEGLRNALITQAALQRQLEHRLLEHQVIDGTPIAIIQHLLDLHWSRQHHTFLLTYRPAIMRDLIQGSGPFYSMFLLNAILACATKYSKLIILREDPENAATAGAPFFRRCDALLAQGSLLFQPSIPTVVGLLLLGSTYNSTGKTSKGWLYTGYALRMVYDLNLHLDPEETTTTPEDIEIRRRVFWGAFICDKLQSLYLGRPTTINVCDCRVSTVFLDTFDEYELFQPGSPSNHSCFVPHSVDSVPMRSISTFQQLCHLSKIMDGIIKGFYVVGAPVLNARRALGVLDNALVRWKGALTPENDFAVSWESGRRVATPFPPPNVMILHSLYHSLVILLHRPFISDGHLRQLVADAPVRACWERCTAAARHITIILQAYRDAYGLLAAPYLVGYAAYVACTIHVRNAAAQAQEHGGENQAAYLSASLGALDAICAANPGLNKPAGIIRRLMSVNGLDVGTGMYADDTLAVVSDEPQGNMVFSDDPASGVNWTAILETFPSGKATEPYGNTSSTYASEEPASGTVLDPLFGLLDSEGSPWFDDLAQVPAV